ncbi:MAG: hypothetical protein ACOZE7_15275 [Pseudomonadota bacterium]
MNEAEYKGMSQVVAPVINAEGELRNLKNRAASACKELEQIVKLQTKQQQKDVPQYLKALAEVKLLEKALPGALNAAAAVLKLASDKNKAMALSVADAKKTLLSTAKPLHVAYELGVSARTAWEQAKRAARPEGYKPPTFVVATANYCESYEHYINEFKIGLGRWSAQPDAGMNDVEYKGAIEVVSPVINAEAQLANLKNRVASGCKELEQIVKLQTKQQQKDVPQYLKALAEMKQLDKTLPAAANAATALLKLVADKKSFMKFCVADAKKEFVSMAKPLLAAHASSVSARSAWDQARKADRPTGYKPPTFIVASANYCEQYEHYISEFKGSLGKWR